MCALQIFDLIVVVQHLSLHSIIHKNLFIFLFIRFCNYCLKLTVSIRRLLPCLTEHLLSLCGKLLGYVSCIPVVFVTLSNLVGPCRFVVLLQRQSPLSPQFSSCSFVFVVLLVPESKKPSGSREGLSACCHTYGSRVQPLSHFSFLVV